MSGDFLAHWDWLNRQAETVFQETAPPNYAQSVRADGKPHCNACWQPRRYVWFGPIKTAPARPPDQIIPGADHCLDDESVLHRCPCHLLAAERNRVIEVILDALAVPGMLSEAERQRLAVIEHSLRVLIKTPAL